MVNHGGNDMARKLIYQDNISKDYGRYFSTTTVLSENPNDSIVLDFYEEYMSQSMVVEVDLESNNLLYNHNEDNIVVNREKKVTVLMTRKNAINLARMILENYEDEEADDNDSIK